MSETTQHPHLPLAHSFLEERDLDPVAMTRNGYALPAHDSAVDELKVRDAYVKRFGFAVPNKKALATIAVHEPILEVGAGSGYWAYELERMDVDIVATDPKTGQYYHGGLGEMLHDEEAEGKHWENSWANVIELEGTEAVERYPERTLLIVWPDYNQPWPAEVLDAYKGDTAIYVGEGPGGCTGDKRFHKLLGEEFECVERITIPTFFTVHDDLTLWRR